MNKKRVKTSVTLHPRAVSLIKMRAEKEGRTVSQVIERLILSQMG